MSCYNDLYNDYPLRCGKIWEDFYDDAKNKKIDVTFMLMCAAGGFAMPWEHLKIQPGQAKDNSGHPAFFNFDPKRYAESLKAINTVFDAHVSESSLFSQMAPSQCFYGSAKGIEFIRDMAESGKNSPLFSSTKKARDVLKVMRNAIAHNNIYAFSRQQGNEITDLTFFSAEYIWENEIKKIDFYHFVVMSVDDFQSFISAWFVLLRRLKTYGKPCLRLVISNAFGNEDGEQIAA
jgi:hypothetical protein